MKKIRIMLLSIMLMCIPMITLAATGHINGCPNTSSYDTSCCTKTFYISAKEGYEVIDVLVNGVSKGVLTSYTFTNITGPQTLKVVTSPTSGSTSGTGSTVTPPIPAEVQVIYSAHGDVASNNVVQYSEPGSSTKTTISSTCSIPYGSTIYVKIKSYSTSATQTFNGKKLSYEY